MTKRDMLRQANEAQAKKAEPRAEKKAETFVDVVAERRRPGRPVEEPRKQVSIYLTEDIIRKLRIAAAEQEKERDQSSLVRSGLEIVLSLSADSYRRLKSVAEQQNTTIGEIVERALSEYLK